jgi:hypothetical protein
MTRFIKIGIANGLPTTGKIGSVESSFNNDGLDQQERAVKKYKTMWLPSIFGRTSTY